MIKSDFIELTSSNVKERKVSVRKDSITWLSYKTNRKEETIVHLINGDLLQVTETIEQIQKELFNNMQDLG